MTYAQAVLIGATTITTSTAPAMGTINSYNASSGALTPALPALASFNVGGSFIVEKSLSDSTLNTITLTCAGTDTFDDGTTSFVLSTPGERYTFQSEVVGATRFWKITNASFPKTGLVAIASEFVLSSSSVQTPIVSYTLPNANFLAAGSTFRISLNGSIQVQSTSGALTFTPFLGNTALVNTFQMATVTTAAGPVGFYLDSYITVRADGTSGTVMAHGNGLINGIVSGALQMLTTNSTTPTTVNTTNTGTPTIAMKATWATASPTNILKVETATIEHVV